MPMLRTTHMNRTMPTTTSILMTTTTRPTITMLICTTPKPTHSPTATHTANPPMTMECMLTTTLKDKPTTTRLLKLATPLLETKILSPLKLSLPSV